VAPSPSVTVPPGRGKAMAMPLDMSVTLMFTRLTALTSAYTFMPGNSARSLPAASSMIVTPVAVASTVSQPPVRSLLPRTLPKATSM
jgi:hypothetical protein